MPDSVNSKIRAEISVRGKVQGVGYRYFAVQEALPLGITGWVQNQPDGSVFIMAEGRGDQLDKYLVQLKIGPTLAFVDDISVQYLPETSGFQGFRVNR